MVTVAWADRKSPVLSGSSLACLLQTPGVNLTLGCAHDCIYCYARGYSTFPGENKVIIYKNIVEKLEVELTRKKTKPQAIYFSPSSDMFQPVPEVLEISHAVLEFLLDKGIGIALLTKGEIPERTLRLLLRHADKVKAQVGIITHNESVRSIFEPCAASIATRLHQMAAMVAGGIAVEARIVPILPGITDTPESVESLVEAVSLAGIKRASISALFLRPAIIASLKRRIVDELTLTDLFGFYRGTKRMPVHASHSSVLPLPRKNREEIYTRFEQSALKHDIEMSVCGCMNPDIGGLCNIAGTWPEHEIQRPLFDEKS